MHYAFHGNMVIRNVMNYTLRFSSGKCIIHGYPQCVSNKIYKKLTIYYDFHGHVLIRNIIYKENLGGDFLGKDSRIEI